MTNRSHTAILFFSRDAFAESIHKPIFGKSEHKKNLEIAQLMIGQTRKVLEQSGLDVIHFTQHDQSGKTFGEKLANAYQSVFDLGYEAVIAIGNDTPEIASISWNSIILNLVNEKSVVGPTQRGGAYLIGIHRNHFSTEEFARLAWQGKDLYSDLILQLEQQGPVVELAPLQELNQTTDLQWFINGSDTKWQFVQLLIRLLKQKNWAVLSLVFILTNKGYLCHEDFRGPPSLVREMRQFVRALCEIICTNIKQQFFQLRFHCVRSLHAKHILFRGPPTQLVLQVA